MAEEETLNQNTQEIKIDEEGKVSIFVKNMDLFNADYTKITGDFKISAESLCKLIPLLDSKFQTWREKTPYGWYNSGGYVVSRDKLIDKLTEELEIYKIKNDDLKNELKEKTSAWNYVYKRGNYYEKLLDNIYTLILKFPKWCLKLFLNKTEYKYIEEFKKEETWKK